MQEKPADNPETVAANPEAVPVDTSNESTETPKDEEKSTEPAIDYGSPESLATYDAETVRLVSEEETEVTELEAKFLARKEAAKHAKEQLEVAEKELRELIRDRRSNRGKPPKPKYAKLYVEDPKPDDPLEVNPEDDAWKATPLQELSDHDGFPQYLVEKLANAERKDGRPQAPITTLGELTAFTEPNAAGYTMKLSDLVGIGAGAVDKISDATIKFWERWRANGNASASGTGSEDFGDGDDETDDDEDADEPTIAIPQGLPD